MGTRMAPAYANLFMGDLERKLLAQSPLKPFIWWRYIDDIFMVWTHGEEKLNEFITHINSSHNTIKFTHEFSESSISFLDVTVLLDNNNQISTDLYVKSTDTHQYLLHTSCHPNHVKKSIPFSLALRIRRICPPLKNLNKEPVNYWNFYVGGDTYDSTFKPKSIKPFKFHVVTLYITTQRKILTDLSL